MPVVPKPGLIPFITVGLICLLLAACVQPQVSSNRYQTEINNDQISAGPVSELQSQALKALDQAEYQLAVDYLQRAIKIEPRNPWNWHYLAQTYLRSGSLEDCLSMLDRSNSYVGYDEILINANEKLKYQCQA